MTEIANKVKSKRVSYVFSEDYLRYCDTNPKVNGRGRMVHSLISAFGLVNSMKLVSPRLASDDDLKLFHSEEYVACLQMLSEHDDDDENHEEEAQEFGLTYDCPAYPGVFNYVRYLAGGSIAAAESILSDQSDVVINWPGGWHHAKRDEAAGFCYINDIVLCILKLREKFERVLYVDLDLHHGDGVEDAFSATAKVMTVSFHKHSPGFFPGSGRLTSIGVGKGRHYTVNVPLKDGIDNEQYVDVFTRVLDLVHARFRPGVVVCQCGADGVAGDPMASYNLTPVALVNCVEHLQTFNIPLILFGGGGYNFANTARCWANITASVLGITLPSEIPDNEHFTKYGPGYELEVQPGNIRNLNTPTYINDIVSFIQGSLAKLNEEDGR